jgi:hypothetical protein
MRSQGTSTCFRVETSGILLRVSRLHAAKIETFLRHIGRPANPGLAPTEYRPVVWVVILRYWLSGWYL